MDLLSELEKDFARWDHLYQHGGQDPCWADGVNLNLVRAHIIRRKQQIEGENARKAQAAFAADTNLAWLREHRDELTPRQRSQTSIDNVIGYSAGLDHAVEHDDLVAMRRYEQPDRYLQSFENAVQRVLSLDKSGVPYEDDDEDFDMEIEV